MGDKPKALTQKQRRFVEEYAGDGNATQAYFRAFGRLTSKGKKRSYRAATEQARRLLAKPDISAEVTAAQAEYRHRIRVDKAKTLREVAVLAFADHGDLFEEDPHTGLPKPIRWGQVSPAARRAIQSVKIKKRVIKRAESPDDYQEEIEEVEYKLHAKGAELDKLCKKLGFYADAKDADGGSQSAAESDAMGRLAALVNARRPVPERTGRGGGGPGGAAPVDPAAGAAESGVPQ